MPADLTALRTGLAANLETLVVTYPTLTVSPYILSSPKPPVIMVRPTFETLVVYHQAFRNGMETWELLIQAYAGALSEIPAQQLLDELVASTGSSSVKAAAESDPTLGGACQQAMVVDCRSYQEYTRTDGGTLLGAEWRVSITT